MRARARLVREVDEHATCVRLGRRLCDAPVPGSPHELHLQQILRSFPVACQQFGASQQPRRAPRDERLEGRVPPLM
jgi:hypothetical protein